MDNPINGLLSKKKNIKMNLDGRAFDLKVNYLIGYEGRRILSPLT